MKAVLLAIIWLTILSSVFGQQVENVKATQAGDKVMVTYDLIDPSNKTYYIKLYATKDGGLTYSDELKFTTGDLRAIKPGVGKKITWDAKQELGYFEGTMSFKVEALARAALLPEPTQNKCYKFEISNVITDNGKLKVDFIVTALIADCRIAIGCNGDSYYIGPNGERNESQYDQGFNNKNLVRGIPVKGTISIGGLEAWVTSIPILTIYGVAYDGCDSRNSFQFKNVAIQK